MLSVMSCHAGCLIEDFADKRPVFRGEFVNGGVSEVEAEAVGFGKMACRCGIIKLGDIFYAKPLAKEGGPEATGKVDKTEAGVAAMEYVGEVEVAVTKAGVVKSLDKGGEAADEISAGVQVLGGGRCVETRGELSFERLSVGDFFGDDEASFFKQRRPLFAVSYNLGCGYAAL